MKPFSSIALSIFLLTPSLLLAQGTTAFTYQGQLHSNGTNANGSYTMAFKLYDAAVGGNQVGSGITNNITLVNGLFTASLDFGASAFTGAARWLDITATSGSMTETLSPRVALLPAPYALNAATASSLTGGGWNATVGNYQSFSNVFGIFANGNLVLGLSTNGILANGNFQANNLNASQLSLTTQLDMGNGIIYFSGTNGGGASLASDGNMGLFAGGNVTVQNALNFGNNGGSFTTDGMGGITSQNSLTISNLTVTGNQLNTHGNGLLLDNYLVPAAPGERLAILRGQVNPNGGSSGGTNFTVTYIPPGTGGYTFYPSVTVQNGGSSFTVANDQTGVFQNSLWMEINGGFYQVTGTTINSLQGGGVTTTVSFLPAFGGTTGTYPAIRNMTLYPTYTINFTNIFSGIPNVIISGGGSMPTQQNFFSSAAPVSIAQAVLDYSQTRTSHSFGVMVYSGYNPIAAPGYGFEFIAVGPR
jgi:hypothetical protein